MVVGSNMMGELWVRVGCGGGVGFVFVFKIVDGKWWFS